MFDIAWSELALIGAVALIVIGPKDLPKVMLTAGRWVRKARILAGEFHRGIDEMVLHAEMEDLRRQMRDVESKASDFEMEMKRAMGAEPMPPEPPVSIAAPTPKDEPALPASAPSPAGDKDAKP